MEVGGNQDGLPAMRIELSGGTANPAITVTSLRMSLEFKHCLGTPVI